MLWKLILWDRISVCFWYTGGILNWIELFVTMLLIDCANEQTNKFDVTVYMYVCMYVYYLIRSQKERRSGATKQKHTNTHMYTRMPNDNTLLHIDI